MRSSRIYLYVMALVMLGTCASCRQELCYDHYPAMDVNFSWELEWERDYGMNHQANWDPAHHHYYYDDLRPSVPEWVKMVKYYDDGRVVDRFLTPEGDKFEVPADDQCSILFYNGDTEYIILSDVASLNDVRATATTRTRSGTALQEMREMYQNSRTTNPPDVIYSAYFKDVAGIKNHEVKPMPVNMQPLVYSYLISYEFESGVEYVALARGALGGMAEGVYISSGVTTDDTSIILFDCDINSDGCRSIVRSFGIPGFPDSYFGRKVQGESPGPFTLSLELKLKNGKTMDFSYDITDQIKNQPRGGVVKITGIKIDDQNMSGSSTGFDVGVSDWDDTEEVDLPIEPSRD